MSLTRTEAWLILPAVSDAADAVVPAAADAARAVSA
jgi:hypothetical protein